MLIELSVPCYVCENEAPPPSRRAPHHPHIHCSCCILCRRRGRKRMSFLSQPRRQTVKPDASGEKEGAPCITKCVSCNAICLSQVCCRGRYYHHSGAPTSSSDARLSLSVVFYTLHCTTLVHSCLISLAPIPRDTPFFHSY